MTSRLECRDFLHENLSLWLELMYNNTTLIRASGLMDKACQIIPIWKLSKYPGSSPGWVNLKSMSLDQQSFLEMKWTHGHRSGGWICLILFFKKEEKKRVNTARASGAGWLSPAEAHMPCLGETSDVRQIASKLQVTEKHHG